MIKYLVMDVDGTLTDGKIYIGNDGELMKAFNIKDGSGIHDIAVPAGIIPVVITGRISTILKERCKELGIDNLYQGVKDKGELLKRIAVNLGEVAYIGDDINDLPCMRIVKEAGGIIGCPADSVNGVITIADFVSSMNGGNGAVREFIEWLVEKNQIPSS